MRLERDEFADSGRRPLAHGNPHPVGLFDEAPSFDLPHLHDHAVAALALLPYLDKAGDLNARRRNLQHRMRDTRGLERRRRKPDGYGRKGQRQRKADRPPARQNSHRNARRGQRGRRPPGRFALGREIADYP